MVEIQVPDEELVRRITGRRVHPGSGRIYHVIYNPPRVDGQDDDTGEALVQREDDTEETVRQRLSVYKEQTEPLVEFYHAMEAQGLRYISVDGQGEVALIQASIAAALDSTQN